MGGLATRQALSNGGPDLVSKVSQVITFGTPNTGSLIAAIAAIGIDAATAARVLQGDHMALFYRTLLSYCGQVKTQNQYDPDLVCSALHPALSSFDSEAGRALRTGSSELQKLPPWPKGLTVNSLAGQTEFTVSGGFFLQRRKTTVQTGDIIVGLESALAGSTGNKTVRCSYRT